MPKITHRKKRLSSFKLIVLGFAGVIVLGALILMLPFSSTAGGGCFSSGESASGTDASGGNREPGKTD